MIIQLDFFSKMSTIVSDITVKNINGEEKKLGDYVAKILLIFNFVS